MQDTRGMEQGTKHLLLISVVDVWEPHDHIVVAVGQEATDLQTLSQSCSNCGESCRSKTSCRSAKHTNTLHAMLHSLTAYAIPAACSGTAHCHSG